MPLKDPSTVFFQSSPTRRLVLASYWVLILLAVPLWWKTTSIERLALPTARPALPLRFPVDVHLSGVSPHEIGELQQELRTWDGIDVEVHSGEGKDEFGSYTVAIDPTTSPSIHGRRLSLPDGTSSSPSTHGHAVN